MSTGLLLFLALVAVVLAIGSALFSAIETSLFSLQPYPRRTVCGHEEQSLRLL